MKRYTSKNLSRSSYLRELNRLREKVRVEILGEKNKEYRQKLKDLLAAVDRKITEVLEEQRTEELAKNHQDEV